MVDTSGKPITKRVAKATACVKFGRKSFKTFIESGSPKGDIFEDQLEVKNKHTSLLNIDLAVPIELQGVIELITSQMSVAPGEFARADFNIIATEIGSYAGELTLSGDLDETIPINITVFADSLDPLFLIETEAYNSQFLLNDKIKLKLNINKLKSRPIQNLTINYSLISPQNKTFFLKIPQYPARRLGKTGFLELFEPRIDMAAINALTVVTP